MAAGVILATGYDGSVPLVNPMCGSGTLAIEAALIASGRPPGLLRDNFGFMHHKGFDSDTWQSMRRDARKIRNKGTIAPIIATDIEALRQTLAGVEAVQGRQSWIPMVGQMVLGFVLPFALTFVAIPFESFIHSARTVLGVFVAGVLRVVAVILRLIGNIALYLGNVVISFYDLLIFPLLWLDEKIFSGRRPKAKATLMEEVKQ